MTEYRQDIHAVQTVDDGPIPPRSAIHPCCAWCGYVIPAECPDDDFDLAECSIRWRTWRNGPVPEAVPVEPTWMHVKNGIPWDEAVVPKSLHQCEAWSRVSGSGQERCACGAIRYVPGYWYGKNSRASQAAA